MNYTNVAHLPIHNLVFYQARLYYLLPHRNPWHKPEKNLVMTRLTRRDVAHGRYIADGLRQGGGVKAQQAAQDAKHRLCLYVHRAAVTTASRPIFPDLVVPGAGVASLGAEHGSCERSVRNPHSCSGVLCGVCLKALYAI